MDNYVATSFGSCYPWAFLMCLFKHDSRHLLSSCGCCEHGLSNAGDGSSTTSVRTRVATNQSSNKNKGCRFESNHSWRPSGYRCHSSRAELRQTILMRTHSLSAGLGTSPHSRIVWAVGAFARQLCWSQLVPGHYSDSYIDRERIGVVHVATWLLWLVSLI